MAEACDDEAPTASRTGCFQLVFDDTHLGRGTRLELGFRGDDEWQAAVRLLLANVSADRLGPIASNSAWQDMTMWLNADERLDTFIRRVLQSVDAAVWLLATAVEELGGDGQTDPVDLLRGLAASHALSD